MAFELRGVSKRYEGREVVASVSLAVRSAELVSIIGPSGAGKTTLLKMIAGLLPVDGGSIDYDRRPSRENPYVLVFQDWLLFPHMSVFENVAFGLRARRRPRDEIRERVMGMLDALKISDKAASYPAALSGGQRQRVALARALVVNPAALLLDEPFANLEPSLKMETAELIRATQKRFGITTVAVTHDLPEAFAMADRIGILVEGTLEQFDTVERIYEAPATPRAASFLGPVNVIPASLAGQLGLSPREATGETILARAEGLSVHRDPEGAGTVRRVTFTGAMVSYDVALGGTVLRVHSLVNGLASGDRVSVRLVNRFSYSRSGEQE